MDNSRPIRQYRWAFALGASLLLAYGVVPAAERSALPRVVVIGTNGTIAGSAASSTEFHEYQPGKVDIQALIDGIPGLRNTVDIRSEQLFQVGSASLTSDHWLKLAHRINKLLAQDDVDGIVVTHGTDTLEETAYFLNLVVKSRKPVIVGSMRPPSAISAALPIQMYWCYASSGGSGCGTPIWGREKVTSSTCRGVLSADQVRHRQARVSGSV